MSSSQDFGQPLTLDLQVGDSSVNSQPSSSQLNLVVDDRIALADENKGAFPPSQPEMGEYSLAQFCQAKRMALAAREWSDSSLWARALNQDLSLQPEWTDEDRALREEIRRLNPASRMLIAEAVDTATRLSEIVEERKRVDAQLVADKKELQELEEALEEAEDDVIANRKK